LNEANVGVLYQTHLKVASHALREEKRARKSGMIFCKSLAFDINLSAFER
jgi:hypothetical protein